MPNGSNIDPSVCAPIGLGSDQWGVGVAAVPGGGVFGLFGNGQSTLYDFLGNGYTGARLRLGSRSGFVDANPLTNASSQVLIGPSTLLATMATGTAPTPASIAYDPQAHRPVRLRCGAGLHHGGGAGVPPEPVHPSSSLNQSPNRSLGDAAANVPNAADPLPPDQFRLAAGGQHRHRRHHHRHRHRRPDPAHLEEPPATGAVRSVAVTIPGVASIRGMALGGTD